MNKINKGGRPSKAIDLELVERMLKGGSSGADIASFLGMNRDHFYRRVHQEKGVPFSEWLAQCKSHTRHNLRVTQLKEAFGHFWDKKEHRYKHIKNKEGKYEKVLIEEKVTTMRHPPNTAMLIYLGKNILGQSDNPEKGGMFGNIPNYRMVGDTDEEDDGSEPTQEVED